MDKKDREDMKEIMRPILRGVLMHAYIGRYGVPVNPEATVNDLDKTIDAVLKDKPNG